jgi:hypothetical protein
MLSRILSKRSMTKSGQERLAGQPGLAVYLYSFKPKKVSALQASACFSHYFKARNALMNP